jgi:hypothetical protein
MPVRQARFRGVNRTASWTNRELLGTTGSTPAVNAAWNKEECNRAGIASWKYREKRCDSDCDTVVKSSQSDDVMKVQYQLTLPRTW